MLQWLFAHASVKMGFKRLNIGIASPLRIHRCALDAPLTRQEFPVLRIAFSGALTLQKGHR